MASPLPEWIHRRNSAHAHVSVELSPSVPIRSAYNSKPYFSLYEMGRGTRLGDGAGRTLPRDGTPRPPRPFAFPTEPGLTSTLTIERL